MAENKHGLPKSARIVPHCRIEGFRSREFVRSRAFAGALGQANVIALSFLIFRVSKSSSRRGWGASPGRARGARVVLWVPRGGGVREIPRLRDGGEGGRLFSTIYSRVSHLLSPISSAPSPSFSSRYSTIALPSLVRGRIYDGCADNRPRRLYAQTVRADCICCCCCCWCWYFLKASQN